MLLNTLQNIEITKILKPLLNDSELNQLLNLLAAYKSGMWLYPGVIKRKIGLSTQTTYTILHELEKLSVVKAYYELYCSNCQKSNGNVIETINCMPETFYCELCHKELPSMENAILIYKVL